MRGDGLALLDNLPRYSKKGAAALKPGFDRIQLLLDHLGNPENHFPIIHIAGSNGKGSTASFAAAISTASGRRTGLHTSPHLVSVTERMRIDGTPAPLEWLDDFLIANARVIRSSAATFFEVTLAATLHWFHLNNAELAVVEVGLGGRLDATNVVRPAVTVITHLALDHTDILGDSLEQIATEKGGIIKPNVPVVVAPGPPGPIDRLRQLARERRAPFHYLAVETVWLGNDLHTPDATYSDLIPGISGGVQFENAALAVRAMECLDPVLSRQAVVTGIRSVCVLSGVRGRYEILRKDPLVVADVAHNLDALLPVVDRFRTDSLALSPGWVLLGVMGDKEVDGLADELRGLRVVPVDLGTDRGRPATELLSLLRSRGLVVDDAIDRAGVSEWLASQPGGSAVLVTGSHLHVGSAISALT